MAKANTSKLIIDSKQTNILNLLFFNRKINYEIKHQSNK